MEGTTTFYFILSITITYLLALSANAAVHSIISDEEALLALKDHNTIDPNQILANNWTVGSPVCGWIGVTCGKHPYRVTALDVSSMGLTGTIVPHLRNLSFLVSLSLSDNNFHGEIPYELGNLSRLKWLNISVNALTGEIPSSFGSLDQLEELDLVNNTFTGSIMSSISNLTNLKSLYLSNNGFTGSIPPEIFNISSLQILFLPYNQLSGNLPTSMCRYLQQITRIEVGYNMLSGLLPSQLSQCSQLISFGVSDNNITGPIPEEFWNMKCLEQAYFDYNHLEGKISKEINNLTSLRVLSLEGNHLTGTIPQEIDNLINLRVLSLHDNDLSGTIPQEIGNLTNLQLLDFGTNYLTGTIPQDLGNLVNLELLLVGFNGLSGLVNERLFNISTLITLDLSNNSLSGSLPSTTGFRLPNLKQFLIAQNNFSGVLPIFISNASRLIKIDVQKNNFGGTIPHSLGNLRFLQFLGLGSNNFTQVPSSLELEFLTPLANCNVLRYLTFDSNPLNGILPKSIGNLSKSIEYFYSDSSRLFGGIPDAIGTLSNLLLLSLYDNQLNGSLPTSFGLLQNLQHLNLHDNQLSGNLSCNLFGLQRLSYLYLHNNMFSGPIPMTLWNLKYLLELNLSSNFLNGHVPVQVGNLNVLISLDLSMNNLLGDIPDAIGNLENLAYLSLTNNLFEGSIPNSIGRMVSLENLYLAQNKLSGPIPTTLEKLYYLHDLNVSYNKLVGLIPSGGPFVNLTPQSFMFNKALCGDKRFHVPPCPALSPKHMLVLCFGLVALVVAITIVSVCLILRRKKKVQKAKELQLTIGRERISEDSFLESLSGMPVRFTYKDLQTASNNFSIKLGQGGFGSVYQGTLHDGTQIAVKKLESIGQGSKEFRAEVSTIGSIHHHHLVRLRGFCADGNHRMLVYEYMANGSLDKWLFMTNNGGLMLDWDTRYYIALGTAKGLAYLHEGCDVKIVHCDIKPENVLIDGNFLAKVSDFGLAKLMTREQSHVFTTLRGTRGYLAPEWVTNYAISEKSDVYSYGMVLLEIIGGRRNFVPAESSAKAHFPIYAFKMMEEGRLRDIIDAKLGIDAEDERIIIAIKVALWCIQVDMSLRPPMTKVVQMLEGICPVPLPPKCNLLEAFTTHFTPTTEIHISSGPSAVRLSGPR